MKFYREAMMRLLKQSTFILSLFALNSCLALSIPSIEVIKRLGKNCTGVCDQPSQVCTGNKDLVKWCKDNCGHKIKVAEVCKKYAAVEKPESQCKSNKISKPQERALAAKAADLVYDFGEKGGYNGADFNEVGHAGYKSGLVAWAGVNGCTLYIAYRGTATLADLFIKDVQIGVAHLLSKLKLGQLAARGPYNKALNDAVDFYEKMVKQNPGMTRMVITGHSLGGAYAQNVIDRVGRNQDNVVAYVFNAPGSSFAVNKVGDGHKDVTKESYRQRGDAVSKWGKHTPGKNRESEDKIHNPLEAHHMEPLKDALDKIANKK